MIIKCPKCRQETLRVTDTNTWTCETCCNPECDYSYFHDFEIIK